MENGFFGLSAGTFFAVIGVPVLITALLFYWGITFDSRFPETVEKKQKSAGGNGRTK